MALSEIKNGDPINFDQISALVTTKVEKSNFYKDLNPLIDFKFSRLNVLKNYFIVSATTINQIHILINFTIIYYE